MGSRRVTWTLGVGLLSVMLLAVPLMPLTTTGSVVAYAAEQAGILDINTATAESPSKGDKSKGNSFEHAVAICVKQVQSELPFANFDAYLVNGIVKMFGTPQSFFKFEKCMAKRGHPMGDAIK